MHNNAPGGNLSAFSFALAFGAGHNRRSLNES